MLNSGDDVGLERPQDSSNGDWSSTVCYRSAKAFTTPRDITLSVAHIAEDAQIERVGCGSWFCELPICQPLLGQ